MITLPKEKLPATRVWPKILFLYGQPKVGKTTILAELENNLIIETDPEGAAFVNALKIQVNSLSEYTEVCQQIVAEKKPYKFVTLDTATFLEEWCVADATIMYKNTTIGKNFTEASVLTLPQGAGYLWLRMSFQKYINMLTSTADHVIITGHQRDKFLGQKKDTDVTAVEIDLTGQIRRIIAAGCDAIGYLYRTQLQGATASAPKTEKLKVSFKTSDTVNCGSRCPYLAGVEMDFDWNKIYPPQTN
jgi:GTPase SAR1 family protein